MAPDEPSARDPLYELIVQIVHEQEERAKIPHEQRCNRGRHYTDKRGRKVCDQTPVPRYMWRVIDRDAPGRNNDWDRAILHPDSEYRAQEMVDELNAKEPKRPWWKGPQTLLRGGMAGVGVERR